MTYAQVTDFRHGPQNARWLGARYIPESKVWAFEGKAEEEFWGYRNRGNNSRTVGLKVVTIKCPYYTVDEGCAMHGESCAPEGK